MLAGERRRLRVGSHQQYVLIRRPPASQIGRHPSESYRGAAFVLSGLLLNRALTPNLRSGGVIS
jgi:hypothetical protein